MWPTFYIPGLARSGRINAEIEYACGNVRLETTRTIGNPLGISDGDSQLMIVSYSGNNTPTWPTSGSDWREIFDSVDFVRPTGAAYGSANTGNPRQKVFWRVFNTGDPDFSVSLTGGGYVEIQYMSVIVKNQNTDDPFFTGFALMQSGSPSLSRFPYGCAQYLEAANEGDLVLSATPPTGTVSASDEPNAGDVEFVCTNVDPSFAYSGHTVLGYLASYNANNLLTHTRDLDTAGWTYVNMTRSTAQVSSSYLPAVTLTPTTAVGKHYVEQSVSLEAGKTYLFSAWGFGSTSFPSNFFYLSYEKPDATVHGVGGDPSSTVTVTITGSTEVTWGGNNASVGLVVGDTGASAAFGCVYSIKISPSVSGTYKLRLHVGDQNNQQPYTDFAGNTSRPLYVAGVALSEITAVASVPFFLPTDASAVTSAPYLTPVSPRTVSVSEISWSNFVMRRTGGKRPLAKLFNALARNTLVSFNDTSITETRTKGASATQGHLALVASHTVNEYLSQKKFYFEVYAESFGTGTTDDCYSIGACPFEAANTNFKSTVVTGDWPGQYSYLSTGKTYTNGTLDGTTISAWSAGDYIGVGLDFTNWEVTFYLNGTLVKTMSMNTSHRYRLWTMLAGFFGEYAKDKQARFTYNFRGPFGGRKPSGFVAFDFDNELT